MAFTQRHGWHGVQWMLPMVCPKEIPSLVCAKVAKHVHWLMYMWVYTYVYTCVCIYICMYIYNHIYIYTDYMYIVYTRYTYVCIVYTYLCVCVQICISTYDICICTYAKIQCCIIFSHLKQTPKTNSETFSVGPAGPGSDASWTSQVFAEFGPS